jgi:multiple antibiotic resistance protein
MNPLLSLGVFVPLVEKMNTKQVRGAATVAVSVAFSLLFLFTLFGRSILDVFGVSLSSFRVAGGIVLLLLAIQIILGIEFGSQHKPRRAAAVVIGTPLLCGPGAITTTIVLSEQHGAFLVICAGFTVMVISWVLLVMSQHIVKFTGVKILEVTSKVFGLLLAAISIEFIGKGIKELFELLK